MANYNRVILAGNLTRDPEMSYLPSQTAVVEFGLAINRTWRGQDGEKREDTCFIDCRCFGKQAETLQKYMSKGRPILVEGRLDYDTWQGQDGTKRSKHRVTVERFQFLGGRGDAAPPTPAQAAPPQAAPAQADPPQGDNYSPPPPIEEPGEEDIPF